MREIIHYEEPLFRPPAEAESLIFQVARGCPHNSCRFCGMYKGVRYHLRNEQEVLHEMEQAGKAFPDVRRIFLADGDVMALPFDLLKKYLEFLLKVFPQVRRINLYANGSSIAARTEEELQILRNLRIHTLYMGLESGCQILLDRFKKKESVHEMVQSVIRTQQMGFSCSVMILLGLAGPDLVERHCRETVDALNLMQMRILSVLRFIPVPGLSLPQEFRQSSEWEAVHELRQILLGLDLHHTVFRANHSSNSLPLAGRFPADKERLLQELDRALEGEDCLDRKGPGWMPFDL